MKFFLVIIFIPFFFISSSPSLANEWRAPQSCLTSLAQLLELYKNEGVFGLIGELQIESLRVFNGAITPWPAQRQRINSFFKNPGAYRGVLRPRWDSGVVTGVDVINGENYYTVFYGLRKLDLNNFNISDASLNFNIVDKNSVPLSVKYAPSAIVSSKTEIKLIKYVSEKTNRGVFVLISPKTGENFEFSAFDVPQTKITFGGVEIYIVVDSFKNILVTEAGKSHQLFKINTY